jgi:L-rhamnonate dehydratase
MKVSGIDCTLLLSTDFDIDSVNTSNSNILVQVYTDENIDGIGETECNPWVIKALIEGPGSNFMDRGLGELLLGQDPTRPQGIWEHLYKHSLLTGRRGAGICAMGAIDMAIWDIYGKAMGKPIWQLVGGPRQEHVTPYASLLPTGKTLREYRASLLAKAAWARNSGFKAAKLEILLDGPCAPNHIPYSDEEMIELVAAGRAAIGREMKMMIDVGYCWRDWETALRVIRRIEKYDLFFVETPLLPDDLEGYARLADATEVAISAGELLTTRFEFADLMDRGHVDVVQPDVGRVGGITEAVRVAAMAADRGKLVVPHCWRSAIGIAATVQLAAALPNCPFIEYLPAGVSESEIRRELVLNEPVVEDGRINLPLTAGLGVCINEEAFERLRTQAEERFGKPLPQASKLKGI